MNKTNIFLDINKNMGKGLIFNTEHVFVIKDINPEDTYHWLVIPKVLCENLNDINHKNLKQVYDVITILRKHYNITSYSLRLNTLRNQEIMQFHVHFIIDKLEKTNDFDNEISFPRIIHSDTIPGLIFTDNELQQLYNIKQYNPEYNKKFQIFSPHIEHAKRLWGISFLSEKFISWWYTGTITLVINNIGIKFLSHPSINNYMLKNTNPDQRIYGTSVNIHNKPYITNKDELQIFAHQHNIVYDKRKFHCMQNTMQPSLIINLEYNNFYINNDTKRNTIEDINNNPFHISNDDIPYYLI